MANRRKRVALALQNFCVKEESHKPAYALCLRIAEGSAQAFGLMLAGVSIEETARALYLVHRRSLLASGRTQRQALVRGGER